MVVSLAVCVMIDGGVGIGVSLYNLPSPFSPQIRNDGVRNSVMKARRFKLQPPPQPSQP